MSLSLLHRRRISLYSMLFVDHRRRISLLDRKMDQINCEPDMDIVGVASCAWVVAKAGRLFL